MKKEEEKSRELVAAVERSHCLVRLDELAAGYINGGQRLRNAYALMIALQSPVRLIHGEIFSRD